MISKSKRFKKGSWQTVFFSTILGLLVLIIIGFLIVSAFRLNQRRTELNSRIEKLQREIQILEEKSQELIAKISQVGTKEYLEKVAKEELNLKKPGEEAIVITKEEEKEPETKEEKGILQKLLEIFKF